MNSGYFCQDFVSIGNDDAAFDCRESRTNFDLIISLNKPSPDLSWCCTKGLRYYRLKLKTVNLLTKIDKFNDPFFIVVRKIFDWVSIDWVDSKLNLFKEVVDINSLTI